VEDQELAKGVASADETALCEFMGRFYAPLYRFLWHLSGSRVDAEDLASQALVRARADIRHFRGDGALTPWMFKVARREWLRHSRRDALERRHDRLGEARMVAPPSEDFIVVQAALARLSQDHRAAFLLIEVEGLTVAEASTALGVPAGTVKSRCFFAKKRLRELLGPSYPEVSNHVQPVAD